MKTMKKLFTILAMLFCIMAVKAQTYAFQHKYSVDKSGMKLRGTGRVIYFTFNDDYSICALSDKNGYRTNYDFYGEDVFVGRHDAGDNFIFVGTKNGIHIYDTEVIANSPSKRTYSPGLQGALERVGANSSYKLGKMFSGTLKFSTDFKKLNIVPLMWKSEGGRYDTIDIYEQCDLSTTKPEYSEPFYE